MREGYYRTATNNIIINNSLHPHVWYPESGDVFKHNIAFGAYRPAAMNRALGPDDKWGEELDYNLFANGEADRLKFVSNGCDEHSLSGDPLFVDADKGNYTVRESSPALEIGFKNFPMNEFGVISERLKALAKTPVIPVLMAGRSATGGKLFKWKGGTVKNIETAGDQSAAGLSAIAGVEVVEVPDGSVLSSFGFRIGDVILECGGKSTNNFETFIKQFEKEAKSGEVVLQISRDQKQREFRFKVTHEEASRRVN